MPLLRMTSATMGAIRIGILYAVMLALAGDVSAMPAQSPPDTRVIPPGARVDFIIRTCDGPPPECLPIGFQVQSQSNQPVTATFEPGSQMLTLSAPAGYHLQSNCAPEIQPAATLQCIVGGLSSPPTLVVTFTTMAIPTTGGRQTLFIGCNNLALTFPTGTTVSQITDAILPSTALVAVWRFDNRTQRFLGYSSLPGAPNDYTSVARLDAVFICVREPATFTQP